MSFVVNPYRFGGGAPPDPVSSPLHYWDLTDLTATAGGGIYDQGSGNWGGLDAPTSPSVLPTGGPNGQGCLEFTRSASSQYLDTPTTEAWDGAQDTMTAAFWVYVDSAATTRSDLLSWTSGAPNYVVGTSVNNAATDYWNMVHYDGSFYQARDTAESFGSTGTWYFMVYSYDGTDMKINKGTTGAAPSADTVATFTQAGISYPAGAAEFAIGTSSTSKGTFELSHDGLMFAVGIWDFALSDAQMDYVWNSGDGRTFSEL